jgi:hypothetical protein
MKNRALASETDYFLQKAGDTENFAISQKLHTFAVRKPRKPIFR